MADNISQVQHITSLNFDITEIPAQMQEIENQVAQCGDKIQEILNKNWKLSDLTTDKDVKNVADLTNNYDKLMKKVDVLEKKLSDKTMTDTARQTYALNEKAYQLAYKLSGVKAKDKDAEMTKLNTLKQQSDELVKQLQLNGQLTDEQKEQLSNMQKQLQQSQNYVVKSQSSQAPYGTIDRLKNYASYRFIGLAENFARSSITDIKDIEYEMMEISRIMGISDEQAKRFQETLFGLSQQYGRSFDDVAEVSLRFAQAGYEENDVIDMTKASLLALNTAELDVENSTGNLISILQQWKLQSSDLIGVIDKLNYTADNNAITTQDLVDGLNKVSSVAKTAGISLNDTIGIMTAMKVASGATGKEVGNALKSIITYIQRPASLNTFEKMGLNIYADKTTGTLLPMMDILQQMSDKWNDMGEQAKDAFVQSADMAEFFNEDLAIALDCQDEYNQALSDENEALNTQDKRLQAQASAGVYRRNYYIALVENMKKAIDVSADLDNATGHSAQENEKHMNTLTAKFNQLQDTLKELAMQFADSGSMSIAKYIIDRTNNIMQLSKSVGGLKTAIYAVFSIIELIKYTKVIKNLSDTTIGIKNLSTNIKNMGTVAKTTGLTLNSLLGILGLILTAVSAITGVIKSHNAKVEEQRQAYIDNAKAVAEEYTELQSLIATYEQISGSSDDVATKKEKLTAVQEELNKKYDLEKDKIDLVNGSYQIQIDKLKELSKEEATKNLPSAINGAKAVLEPYYNNTDKQYYTTLNEEDFNKYQDIIGSVPNLYFGGHKPLLANKYDTFVGSEGNSAERYNAITEALTKMAESGITSGKIWDELILQQKDYKQETEDIILPLEIEIQNIKNSGIECADYEEHLAQLTLAKKALGISTAEIVTTISDEKSGLVALTSSMQDLNTESASYLNTVFGISNDIKDLNGYISTLNEGNALTSEQLVNLIQNYGITAEQVETCTDGYRIEASVLEELRQTKIDEANTSMEAQIQSTLSVLNQTASRLGMYENEISAIKDLATAQEALKTLTTPYSDDVFKETQEEFDAVEELAPALQEIIRSMENIELAKSALMNLGTSSGSSLNNNLSTTKDVLAEITDEFQYLNSFGTYTIDEQISKWREFGQAVGLSTENIRSVNKNLYGLYKNAISDQISQLNNLKQAELDRINDTYGAELDCLKQIKNARDELREDEDYDKELAEAEEELLYWQQREGTEASENRKSAQEKIDEIKLKRSRALEDRLLEAHTQSIENAQQAEIDAVNNKYDEITSIFTDANVNMLATASTFAPQIYQKFKSLMIDPMKTSIYEIQMLMQMASITSGNSLSDSSIYNDVYGNTSSNTTSGSINYSAGSKVKITSGATYTNGVTVPSQYINKPYTIMQEKADSVLIKELYSWISKGYLAQARTGGYTLADGLTMLHKGELIVNSDLTNGLKKMVSTYNTNNNNYDNRKENKIEFHSPILVIENYVAGDEADEEVLANKVTRALTKTLNGKL